MISALGTAAYAIDAQMNRFQRSAERVAQSADPDYVQETVEQMASQHAVAANVAVIKATDTLVGTLFDLVA
jgi:hypothetical protein